MLIAGNGTETAKEANRATAAVRDIRLLHILYIMYIHMYTLTIHEAYIIYFKDVCDMSVDV